MRSNVEPVVRTRNLLLLSALLATPAWAGRKERQQKLAENIKNQPAASADDIPALAELLDRAGWDPTPELSGAFDAGAIFTRTSLGHQLALDGCFEVPPKQSTYTETEVMTQLQAGVSVHIGAGAVSGNVGVVKKVKFGTPIHYALPALEMTPTDDCRAKLGTAAARGMDLSTMYVVKEVLFAEIAEQTCGRVDASGRFVGLGSADAELAMACAQASLEPVAVAYRTTPIAELLGGAGAVTAPVGAGGAASINIGGADLTSLAAAAAAKKEERERLAREEVAATAAYEDELNRRFAEAVAAVEAKATAEWAAVAPLARGGSPEGLELAEAFLEKYTDASVTLDDKTRAVALPEVGEAERLVRQHSAEALASAVSAAKGGATATRSKRREDRRVMSHKTYTGEQRVSEEYRRLAREKRHQEMDTAKRLLSQGTMKGESKGEMMRRLADLYFGEGRDIRLTEDASFQEQFDACFNEPSCDTEALEPDHSGSDKWIERSIKLYNQILSNYPTLSRVDEASFSLGSAYGDTDQEKEAVKEFNRLVKSYPESRRVPDAYVMIGEYYFNNNNAFKALLAYKKAAAYRDSPDYPFAMYKMAWCYYNVGEYGNAIDTMKAVVVYSMSSASGASILRLRDESLKDMVRFYADAGAMDEAYNYFTKLGKKELIRSMLKRLASSYFEQGKFEQCIQIYRRLIAEDPHAGEAPEYQNEIILVNVKISDDAAIAQEIQRLQKTYGDGSSWARANAADRDALREARRLIDALR